MIIVDYLPSFSDNALLSLSKSCRVFDAEVLYIMGLTRILNQIFFSTLRRLLKDGRCVCSCTYTGGSRTYPRKKIFSFGYFQQLNLYKYYKGQYVIVLSNELLDAYKRRQQKGQIRIDPSKLHFQPKDWSRRRT